MANLLGQNIGTNYKGILNLNTLNGNLSGTLQAVTDGDGNASPLQLSTTNVAMTFADTSGLFYGPYSSGGVYSGIWDNKIAVKNTTNFSLLSGNGETYLNAASGGLFFSINGPSTPLMNLTTSGFAIGQSTTSASARLHVRGDGTNPIARFESNSGTYFARFSEYIYGTILTMNALSITENTGSVIYTTTNNGTGAVGTLPIHSFSAATDLSTTLTSNLFRVERTIQPAAGSANFRLFGVEYTINASGAQTGTATGIFLNATETALNGMTHNLMDLQVGGVSKFYVSRTGAGIFQNTVQAAEFYSGNNGLSINGQIKISSTISGIVILANGTTTDFNRLQLGGTTNAFPAIKRNAAAIDFRLADDSGYANVVSKNLTSYHDTNASAGILAIDLGADKKAVLTGSGGTNGMPSVGSTSANDFGIIVSFNHAARFTQNLSLIIGGAFNVTEQTSAILQLESTTRGFLPPRMTTTQKNAITTPATGLVLYDTTLNKLAVYTGSAWETVTSI
jgi:hypothetical protein